ncbi:hypothetical protein [Enterococcus phage vB_EfaS_140]|uniref:Uncharacterized protein n=1 Tax=Enterococcus phage vB_EfaS_140 TaxID=2730536 RepID=A0ACA9ASF2_9CAUD|nr:hypothetical protein [Enterococcus phage vB_EfaS_140]
MDIMTKMAEEKAKQIEEQCFMDEAQYLIKLYLDAVKDREEQKIKIAKLEKELSDEKLKFDKLNNKTQEIFRKVKDKL